MSLSQNKPGKLFDPIRKEWVAALPEEQVRQHLLHQMIDHLGYPPELISCEVSLKEMPHLSLPASKIPQRRADVLCYGKDIHPQHALYPLLLIECKAVPIGAKAVRQVLGYNAFVGAHYVCLVNQHELRLGWTEGDEERWIDFLPPYHELLS